MVLRGDPCNGAPIELSLDYLSAEQEQDKPLSCSSAQGGAFPRERSLPRCSLLLSGCGFGVSPLPKGLKRSGHGASGKRRKVAREKVNGRLGLV